MLLNDALQTIGLLGGIAGAVLVAGPTPRQRAAGFATWIAGNGAWVTDAGTWQVWWTESNAVGILGGGENHIKVSRFIDDLKEALKTHDVDARHIIRPGPEAVPA